MPKETNKKNKKTKVTNSKPKVKKTKTELITGAYKYEPKDDEKLIMDKPSTPLVVESFEPVEKVIIQKVIPKTNGQIYDAYIKELKLFKLVYNGDVIYDSSLSKNNSNLEFESDYFILFGKKYSYNGLRVQKI